MTTSHSDADALINPETVAAKADTVLPSQDTVLPSSKLHRKC